MLSHWDICTQSLDFPTGNILDVNKHINELEVLYVCNDLSLFKHRREIANEN